MNLNKIIDIIKVCNILWSSPISILPCFLPLAVSGVRKGGRGLTCPMLLTRRAGASLSFCLCNDLCGQERTRSYSPADVPLSLLSGSPSVSPAGRIRRRNIWGVEWWACLESYFRHSLTVTAARVCLVPEPNRLSSSAVGVVRTPSGGC